MIYRERLVSGFGIQAFFVKFSFEIKMLTDDSFIFVLY